MAYNSAHTGPEIDAAVEMLGQIQSARDATSSDRAAVVTLASQVAASANQVASQASTVSTKTAQVLESATAVEQAHAEVLSASESAVESKEAAALSAGAAQESQASAGASEFAASQSQLAAGLSEQISAENAASTSEDRTVVDELARQVEAASASAALSAQNAAAVVSGGTAALASSPGKIPLANAQGKIDPGWLGAEIARTSAIQGAIDTAQSAEDSADLATARTARFLTPVSTPPMIRDDGTPLHFGDRYVNTENQAEYIYKASGWIANDSLAAIADIQNPNDPNKGAALWGYKGRDGYERLGDTLSVRDHIMTAVDGATVNQAGIVAAVAAAKAVGAELYWPAGVHVSDAQIPDLHAVAHAGPGAIKRGSSLFYPGIAAGKTNRLYVAKAGSGDGLSASEPIGGLSAAFVALKNYGPTLRGQWYLELASGLDYAPAKLTDLSMENMLVIRGPSVAPGVTPLAQIDASGFAPGYGLWVGNNFKVWLQDIKSINAAGTTVASNIVLDNSGYAYLKNVHTDNAVWSGVNANIAVRLVVVGGNYKNATYPIRAYGGSVFTVGSETERTKISNATSYGFIAQGSYGHCDYVDFADCPVGISAELHGHSTNYFNTFTNCNVGWSEEGFGTVSSKSYTLTNVTQRQRAGAGFSTQDDAAFKIGIQFRDYVGGNGRWAFGYPDWITPAVNFQFCRDGTTLGASLSPYSPATVLLESSGNTVLALAAPDASYGAIWFGNTTLARHTEIRATAGTLSVLFNSAGGYSFSTTRLAPATDNDKSLGGPSARWSVAYAGTATISTSDERFKQQISRIDEAVLRAWAKVEYMQYKFNDAVEAKGDDARWHFGLIAQRVKEAFEAEGLDAFAYGVLCYDEWPEQLEIQDDEGNVMQAYVAAGNRYGIRYEEALALECAYLRTQLKK